MVDSTYLVEVYRPQQAKKLPNAQKNRSSVSVAALLAATGGPFVPEGGGTMTGPLLIARSVDGPRMWLAKYISGTGHTNAPTAIGPASVYAHVGGREYGLNSYRFIGFGYVPDLNTNPPAVMGYQEKNAPGDTFGDLVFGTRNTNSNVAPTIRLRVTAAGQIEVEDPAYVPGGDQSLTDKKYVDAQVATAVPLTQKGAANGVATLDASGKVPTAQVNVSGLNYLGTWDAATNTPALTNGTGNVGDFYKVSTAGSHDFGAGVIAFAVGDWVIYEGGVWQQVGGHEAVASVNSKTGAVVLTAADVGAVPAVGTVAVVYANDESGNHQPFAYTVAATPGTFPFRDGSGRIQVASGSASSDAANVGQLDARLSAAQRAAIDALTTIATADATDPATTMALVNECKAKMNDIIAALKAT